jgi:hypothetical protein
LIDLFGHVVEMVGAVDDLEGRVYSDYPARVPSREPYAVVSEIGNTSEFISDGVEVIASMTYSVDIFAPARADCRRIASDICTIAARHNGHRVGLFDGFSEAGTKLSRINLTLRFRADRRGATYS